MTTATLALSLFCLVAASTVAANRDHTLLFKLLHYSSSKPFFAPSESSLSSNAAPPTVISPSDRAAPPPGMACCAPEQFETMAEAIGFDQPHSSNQQQSVNSQSTATISYDATNMKMAYTEVGASQLTKTIVDGQKKMIYEIVGEQCTKYSTPDFNYLCIPNAGTQSRLTFGFDKNLLTLTDYRIPLFDEKGPYTDVIATDDCMVISQSISATPPTKPTSALDQQQVVLLITFYNTTSGIADPSVFTPPPSCNDQPLVGDSTFGWIRNFYWTPRN